MDGSGKNWASRICANDTAQLCAPDSFTGYAWNTGQTSPCISTQQAGAYFVGVTGPGGCPVISDTINIIVDSLPVISITASGDTLNLINAPHARWYLNDSAIPGAVFNQWIIQSPGVYKAGYTNTHGCTGFSNSLIITALTQFADAPNITVFPNPSSSGWQLNLAQLTDRATAGITNIEGQLVWQSAITAPQTFIPFNGAAGIYILRVNTGSGSFNTLLVKQ